MRNVVTVILLLALAGFAEAAEIPLKILAINDLHGSLDAGRTVGGRPVGSAEVLAAYLRQAERGMEDHTLIVHDGDVVGASPPVSALMQDEPTVMFLNLLANRFCTAALRLHPRCNLVGTIGNHEFDKGLSELKRLISGGNSEDGPYLESPWRGSRFPWVSANIVRSASGLPVFVPFIVKEVAGVRLGVIGAILREAPEIISAKNIEGLRFDDEVLAINRQIPQLKTLGVRAIAVLLHQGGRQSAYEGPTRKDVMPEGEVADIIGRLDDEVDVVFTGHSHSFTNAFIANERGKGILAVQAYAYGTAFADVDLVVDSKTGDVVHKSAEIVTTFADSIAPDEKTRAFMEEVEAKVGPKINEVIGTAAAPVTNERIPSGESALGNLIADAQRVAMQADFGFMNNGGIRADIDAGEVTYGDLFTVQPFGNVVAKLTLTGAQIRRLLEQQWQGQPYPRQGHVSGLKYTWDPKAAEGSRIVSVSKADGTPLDPGAAYTLAASTFLADGGDNMTVLREAQSREVGPADLDALIAYIRSLQQPFSYAVEGRISLLP